VAAHVFGIERQRLVKRTRSIRGKLTILVSVEPLDATGQSVSTVLMIERKDLRAHSSFEMGGEVEMV
jgi:hypothetical protein